MPAETTGQLCLAQNQYALMQDRTKGLVNAIAGPFSFSLSANDSPVIYDRQTDKFVLVDLQRAITQNAFVPEGHYLVLENPSFTKDGALNKPAPGSNSPIVLEVGRKINISGPATFPLWPGQFAEAIPGHHLRSNQYLVIRVYNADEAAKNVPDYLKAAMTTFGTGEGAREGFTPGQLLVIKGTEVSFFIPPTGFEVLRDAENGNQYVREALTLERLEYTILLDEEGSKRYEKGPQVVFPEATERFITKDNARKFKAIELNDQMGLYVKVIADYEEVGREYKTGEELFITGREQRIYYPRPEHALIEYKDPAKDYMRQRYYGITIPKGEGRYVLDKTEGKIGKQEGPQIFLPDPRNETIVRRVLDDRTVSLWYPDNEEAAQFNRSLRALAEESTSYLADAVVLNAAADLSRGINRGTSGNIKAMAASAAYAGDQISRGGKFAPPPMLTLNTKFDGVPSIHVFTGYAVQVVDKSGNRRVVVGDNTLLLEYDESLTVLELSTGKPKTADTLKRDVYLRVDNNLISDIVRIESRDLVSVDLKMSYRVNFLREHQDQWFSVENYVKYLCDQLRSLLKASLKKHSVKDIVENAAALVRDVVLGTKGEKGEPRHRFFHENGMDVYDVDVLGVQIADSSIATLLKNAQNNAVQSSITLAAAEQNLVDTKRKTEIDTEMSELQTSAIVNQQKLAQRATEAKAEAALLDLTKQIEIATAKLDADVSKQTQLTAVSDAELARDKATDEHLLTQDQARTALFEKRMAAITPNLIQALTTLGENRMVTELATALAPMALHEQQGLTAIMERTFKGTALEQVLANITK